MPGYLNFLVVPHPSGVNACGIINVHLLQSFHPPSLHVLTMIYNRTDLPMNRNHTLIHNGVCQFCHKIIAVSLETLNISTTKPNGPAFHFTDCLLHTFSLYPSCRTHYWINRQQDISVPLGTSPLAVDCSNFFISSFAQLSHHGHS